MGVDVRVCGGALGRAAQVTASGELVTAQLAYDQTQFNAMVAANTAYPFYYPIPSKQFVVTAAIIRANKDVSNVADATIVIYEAADDTTTTVDKTLVQVVMVRFDSIITTPLRILVNEGKVVSAKTTEASIHMTLTGYFIEAIGG